MNSELQATLNELKKEITKAFRALSLDLVQQDSDDLCMIGLATSSGLDYIAPVCKRRSDIENVESFSDSDIFVDTYFEYYGAPDEHFSKVDALIQKIFVHINDPNYYCQTYETLLSGIEEAKADRIVTSDGRQFAIVACIAAGTDWGARSMYQRLNPKLEISKIFSPPQWEQKSLAEYVGPKSSWVAPWGTSEITKVDGRLFFGSYGDLCCYNPQSDRIVGARESHNRNGYTAIAHSEFTDSLICLNQYGAEGVEASSLKAHWTKKTEYRFCSISLSPSGEHFVSGSMDGPATVWETKTGKLLSELQHPEEEAWVMGVSWNPDGKTIATSGRNLGIRLWDANSLTLIDEIENGGDHVKFLPDGEHLAVASGYSDYSKNRLRILNLPQKTSQCFDKIEKGIVNHLRISENGKFFALFTGTLSTQIEVFERSGIHVSKIDIGYRVLDALFLDDQTLLLGGDWGEPTGPFIRWKFLEKTE